MDNQKKISSNCDSCEFNVGVCCGSGVRTDNKESTYGMPITEAKKMFPDGCESYEVSLKAYSE